MVDLQSSILDESGATSKRGRTTYNQDSMINKFDYVELGLACADVCRALHQGMNGRRMGGLSQYSRQLDS